MSIAEIKEKKFKKALEKLGINLALLFGSRADGRFRKNSDFDIAYFSHEPVESFGDIFRPLMEYIGSDNLHVVHVSLANVKPLFLYEVMNNCKVLYAKNMTDFYNLRAYAFKRYYDEVKPLFKLKFERLKEQYLV
jgi:predicted nucleotidyltransferase